jgi:hypothetical protein
MKFTSPLFAAVSGSLGGSTFARNRFGNYVRARAVPINPQTVDQQAVREIFANLANAWQVTLTQAQRDSWANYATQVSKVDVLGATRFPDGQKWFIGNNAPRLRDGVGAELIAQAPTQYNTGLLSSFLPTPDASDDNVAIAFDNAEPWANEDGAYMLLQASRPISPSRTFFKGPFRFLGAIAGDAVTPPSSPATFPLPFPVEVGQKLVFRARIAYADGRLTSPFSAVALAAA